MTRRQPRPAWLLPLILLLGAILRFQRLPDRGLLYWDEGKFALEGIRLRSLLEAVGSGHGVALAGKAVGTAKPTHALLIALAYLLLGTRDYAPLVMDAAFSTLQVALLFLLARRLFGPVGAAGAALFLAVSEYDVLYARSALSESDADFFLTAAVLLWIVAWRRTPERWEPAGRGLLVRLTAGALLGLAFTINYRLIVYIGVFGLIDVLLLLRRTGLSSAVRAGLVWGGGFLLIPVVWEIVGVVLQGHGIVLFRSEITNSAQSYISEVAYQIHGGKQAQLRFDPTVYLQWYALRETAPLLVVAFCGVVLAALNRTLPWMVAALMVLLPYLIYTFAPFIVPRNLDATLPFASLLAGGTIGALWERMRQFSWGPTLPVLLALAASLPPATLSWRLGAEHSGFARAASFLAAHDTRRALISNEVMLFYLRGPGTSCSAPSFHQSLSTVARAQREGIRYVVLDVYDTHAKRFILEHGRRVERALAVGTENLGENPLASENGSPPGGHLDQHVDVYTLRGLHIPVPPKRGSLTCTLDHVA